MATELALVASNCGFVAAGATCGALSRYGVAELAKTTKLGAKHPFAATFAVNVVGSLVLGCVTGAVRPGSHGALLAGTGFCGAFTTFSTYAVDAVKLVQAGNIATAAGYIAASNAASIGAVVVGLKLVSHPPVLSALSSLRVQRPLMGRLFPAARK